MPTVSMSSAEERPLPDPRAEYLLSAREALLNADQAARSARRLLDLSRYILTGNMAMFFCLPPTLMLSWDVVPAGHWSRILGTLMMFGFAIWTWASLLCLGRIRTAGGVKVVDGVEANLKAMRKHPFRGMLPFVASVVGVNLAWIFLFKILPNSGVVLTMWTVLFVVTSSFVVRFIQFRFWEDILFATSVAGAWSLYLLHARSLAFLAIAPPLAVVVGTVCLHLRWNNWVRTLPKTEDASITSEPVS